MTKPVGIKSLLNVKAYQVQMMNDRGYTISDHEKFFLKDSFDQVDFNFFKNTYIIPFINDSIFSYSAFNMQYYIYNENNELVVTEIYYINPNMENAQTMAKSADMESIVNIIKEFIKKYNYNPNANLIIISELPISPHLSNRINTEYQALNLQMFYYSMLSLNPTKHFLNSKYVKMTKAEADEFLKANNLSVTNMIERKSNDIMMLWYGAKIGDMFKIIRDSGMPEIIDFKQVVPIIVTRPTPDGNKKTKMSDLITGKN